MRNRIDPGRLSGRQSARQATREHTSLRDILLLFARTRGTRIIGEEAGVVEVEQCGSTLQQRRLPNGLTLCLSLVLSPLNRVLPLFDPGPDSFAGTVSGPRLRLVDARILYRSCSRKKSMRKFAALKNGERIIAAHPSRAGDGRNKQPAIEQAPGTDLRSDPVFPTCSRMYIGGLRTVGNRPLVGLAEQKKGGNPNGLPPFLMRPKGLEPPAYRSATCRSNPLSYGRLLNAAVVYQRPRGPSIP